jgi:hypothetical protein
MELRARTRLPQVRRVAMMAMLGALLVPATAGAKTHAPTIKSISPRVLNVGDRLTIHGKYFRRGRHKDTVVFQRDGARAVFVKADLATSKLIYVTVPAKVGKTLAVKAGARVRTRFHLRIMTTRLGQKYRSSRVSPLIGPKVVSPVPGQGTPVISRPPAPTAAGADCDGDGLKNAVDTDDDNDLLPDTIEVKYGLNPCNPDSDGDGVSDGFEFQSALDLNDDDYQNPNGTVPYPGKRPYPNPRDGSDADTDFDGDGLSMAIEYRLWRYSVAHNGELNTLTPLSYSDGLKYSKYSRDAAANDRRVPDLPVAGYAMTTKFLNLATANHYRQIRYPDAPGTSYSIIDFDRDGTESPNYLDTHGELGSSSPDGFLSDDERDEDGDGLSNYQETIGPMQGQSWWDTWYPGEKKFTPVSWPGTQVDNPDTDGDGILDGADDQDHDDYPNVVEDSRARIVGFTTAERVKANVSLADDKGVATLKVTAKVAGAAGNRLTVIVTAPTTDTRQLIIKQSGVQVEQSPEFGADKTDVLGWSSSYVDVVNDAGGLPVPVTAPLAVHDPTQDDLDQMNLPLYGRVNPFNPCLPYPDSRSCPTYNPTDGWAPFDKSLDYLIVQ